jgi:methionyl-tRNA synthetase
MIERACNGVVPTPDPAWLAMAPERALAAAAGDLIAKVKTAVRSFQLSVALRDIWEIIGATNRYLVTREPWKLARSPDRRPELHTALYLAADTLRVVAELVRPFMPGSGERMLRMLGVEPQTQSWASLRTGELRPNTSLGAITALFPRIEQSVEDLRKMAADSPASNQPPGATMPVSPGGTPSAASKSDVAVPADHRVTYDDFMKIELRAARVVSAERVPKSKKLLKIVADLGTEQRTIVAGIAEAYEPETLVGRTVAIVFNLQPAKLMGIESNGMILAASPDDGKPELLTFDQPPPPGTRIR